MASLAFVAGVPVVAASSSQTLSSATCDCALRTAKSATFGNTQQIACFQKGSSFYASTPAVTYKPAQEREFAIRASAEAASDEVPDMAKRNTMNLILVGGAAIPTSMALGVFAGLLVPPKKGGGSGGVVARDALGNEVTSSSWLEKHKPGDRSLVQGLKGDPTYLVVSENGAIDDFGVNAVCTHLGCVVPWNVAANKFMCPCHGSQYDKNGKVVRGPAPLSLALAKVAVLDDGVVELSTWTAEDFRSGEKPWWS